MINWLQPLTFTGDNIKLIPLEVSHKEDLLKAATDGELWNIWYTTVPSFETIDNYLKTALKEQDEGKSLPFVIIDKKSNKIIG